MAKTKSYKKRMAALRAGKSDLELRRGAYADGDMYKRMATKKTKSKVETRRNMEKKHKKRALYNPESDYKALLFFLEIYFKKKIKVITNDAKVSKSTSANLPERPIIKNWFISSKKATVKQKTGVSKNFFGKFFINKSAKIA